MVSLLKIQIARGASFVTEPVEAARLVFGGLENDLHTGLTRPACGRVPWHKRKTPIANTRQVSIVSAEECAEIAAALGLPEVDPRLIGANLVISGIAELSALASATRLQFPSGATLFIAEENMPCRHAGAQLAAFHDQPRLTQAFVKAALGRRGLVALVESEGDISEGDEVKLIEPRPRRPPPKVRAAAALDAAAGSRAYDTP